MKHRNTLLAGILFLAAVNYGSAQNPTTVKQIEDYTQKNYAGLEQLYKELHQNPELSLHEEKTSQRIASELRTLGFEVFDKIGGYGVAAVLRNGNGPTVLLRTDMDALPLEEKTGLPYASRAQGVNAAGQTVSVMHACGHDIHMTVFIGTARALVETRKQWKGTLVLVGQISEENGMGADRMFKDGLYSKVPVPDYALAIHDNANLPAGTIGYRSGPFMASVDMMDITVYGKGGHGAAPHTTIDPIVLSAEMIMAFQTIVSREMNPIDPAVVTVGSIHGGTVHNIISDQVKLQLTLRSYSPDVREKTIASIRNKSKYLALQAGLPEDKLPVISILEPQIPATLNDPELTQRLTGVLIRHFGRDNVVETPPSMVGEDFSRFALQPEKKVPICMFWIGAADPAKVKEARANGSALPSLHSPMFAPLPEPTIKTGIKALATSSLYLFQTRP